MSKIQGRYQGKNVVITGGTSGIGLSTAQHLIAEGARVLVTGRSQGSIEAANKELGPNAIVVASDAAKLDDIDALARTVERELGPIDLLFVNAGIAKFLPLENVTEAFYDETAAINSKGAYFTVQKLAPLLRDGSAVVLNTSVVDEKGMPATSVYASTKAALRSLARTFATELLPRGIRVNAVSPGPISTSILEKGGMSKEQQAGLGESILSANPMHRFGRSEEVAKAVLFLGFDATYTTGAELPVDGGMTQL